MCGPAEGPEAAEDVSGAPTPSHTVTATRRQFLSLLAIPPLLPLLGRTPALAATPTIRPRTDWAGALEPTGPLEVEGAGAVKYLLVHHTDSPNGYSQARVPELIRGFYRFHTGPEKRWPDVAYNFFVDAYGGVWEARKGSLSSPVIGSATGGYQGHAQLCCFIGAHATTPPTAAAQEAMTRLLAWLADMYDIDTRPGITTSFVSRGSNRWPAGALVTTPTISGHRQMSLTTCPGDAAFDLVQNHFPAQVSAQRHRAPVSAPNPTPTTDFAGVTAETSTPAPVSAPTPTSDPTFGGGTRTATTQPKVGARQPPTMPDGDEMLVPAATATAIAALLSAAALAIRHRCGSTE